MADKMLRVPPELADLLADEAKRRGVSTRALTIELLSAALGVQTEKPKRGGWRGNPASLEALMKRADDVTDKGRNDPESGSA